MKLTKRSHGAAPTRIAKHHRRLNGAALLAGLGLGVVLGASSYVAFELLGTVSGAFNALSVLTSMIGTYLCLMLLVLVSRIPAIERSFGHDRMVILHRTLAPYSLFLIGAHVIFSTVGYALGHNINVVQQFVDFNLQYPWMLPATVGFGLMVMAGVASYRRVRSKMKYETWWTTHLYFYVAVAISFGHQIEGGRVFLNNPWLKPIWISVYALVAATILVGRIALPLAFSLRHRLRVAAVVEENKDVVSIYITGRKLDQLKARGGQFFQWRFMVRDWWWQAHPYSLSAAPHDEWLRITVKSLGDQSSALSKRLKPGTRVVAEGPYGIFTEDRRYTDEVVAFAAGIGITPIRAMLEELPLASRATVIYRALDATQAPLMREMEELGEQRGWNVHCLFGPPADHPLTLEHIEKFAPRIGESDIYICGPGGFTVGVQKLAEAAGVPEFRVHHEAFAF